MLFLKFYKVNNEPNGFIFIDCFIYQCMIVLIAVLSFFSNLGGFDFIILIKYVNSVIAMFFMTVVFIIEIVV